jgi:hypothetical protein
MDAGPLLAEIGRRLDEVGLDAVLIGNAAAALQGAPVITVDFDFLFRKGSHTEGSRTGSRAAHICSDSGSIRNDAMLGSRRSRSSGRRTIDEVGEVRLRIARDVCPSRRPSLSIQVVRGRLM